LNPLDVVAPKPPGQLFRVVKCLSTSASSAGVYLCLPRDLPPLFEPSNEIDEDLYGRDADIRNAFQTLPGSPRLHQQLPLLSYKKLNDVLYENIQHNGTSSLRNRHLKRLPQLVVVKMRKETDKLRNEVLQVEEQHKRGGKTSLHVGSHVMRAQFTASPSTSYICLRPVFGPTLAQFGEASTKDSRSVIPGWFVSHICVGMIDAMGFLHDEGIMHGKIEHSNIMLSLYPTFFHYRYRGYPDVQLIDFSLTGHGDDDAEERDNRAALTVMEQVITEWSDVAPFMQFPSDVTGLRGEGDDPLFIKLRYIRMQLREDYDGTYNLPEIRERAVDIRHGGPEVMPWNLMKLLHSDLVTADELDRAVRDPLVFKVQAKKEAMAKILEDVPVTMGVNGHAGMKTQSIMVMRFVRRKLEFLDAIGEFVREESTDDETWAIGNRDASFADDEMSGMEP
jgi:hypothetical protein